MKKDQSVITEDKNSFIDKYNKEMMRTDFDELSDSIKEDLDLAKNEIEKDLETFLKEHELDNEVLSYSSFYAMSKQEIALEYFVLKKCQDILGFPPLSSLSPEYRVSIIFQTYLFDIKQTTEITRPLNNLIKENPFFTAVHLHTFFESKFPKEFPDTCHLGILLNYKLYQELTNNSVSYVTKCLHIETFLRLLNLKHFYISEIFKTDDVDDVSDDVDVDVDDYLPPESLTRAEIFTRILKFLKSYKNSQEIEDLYKKIYESLRQYMHAEENKVHFQVPKKYRNSLIDSKEDYLPNVLFTASFSLEYIVDSALDIMNWVLKDNKELKFLSNLINNLHISQSFLLNQNIVVNNSLQSRLKQRQGGDELTESPFPEKNTSGKGTLSDLFKPSSTSSTTINAQDSNKSNQLSTDASSDYKGTGKRIHTQESDNSEKNAKKRKLNESQDVEVVQVDEPGSKTDELTRAGDISDTPEIVVLSHPL